MARISDSNDFDAVVIGAGFSGLGMLHRLRDVMGLSVQVYENGSGVGGTWYWNRYPGARCDSESYIYCFSFSKELLQDWTWSGKYPEQPEILSYLEHVADRFDLRRNIQFDTRVTTATFHEASNRWEISTDKGDRVTARYLITAIGCISTGNVPPIEGLDSFQGDWYHTGAWPHDPVDFSGKRVGVIGTGSSGVQSIPVIAQQARSLTVFQRTPSSPSPPATALPTAASSRKRSSPTTRKSSRRPAGARAAAGANPSSNPPSMSLKLSAIGSTRSSGRRAATNSAAAHSPTS